MKVLLPILFLLIASGITAVLVIFKPDAAEVAPERPLTSVEIIEAQPQTVQLTVSSQGTVLPRTESDLSAEVSGRILEVAENFRAGGRIRAGDVLVKIDPANYEAAVATAAAELANAELTLALEQAQAEQAAADWAALGEGAASDLTLRKPQLAQAKARIESARANLKRAQRDLAQTELKAPFDGRVLSTAADLGQFVSAAPATPVARIYATDRAEIRLPVTTREAELLETKDKRQRYVRIQKANTPNSPTWTARFARMEATIDPNSRLLYAVAVLEAPFEPNADHPEPLRRGQFVTAEIEGRTVTDVYILPRYALRGSDTVYIEKYSLHLRRELSPMLDPFIKALDPVTSLLKKTSDKYIKISNSHPVLKIVHRFNQKKLETRTVSIIQSNAEQIIITQGLAPGERVAISPIAYYIENMPVEVMGDGG